MYADLFDEDLDGVADGLDAAITSAAGPTAVPTDFREQQSRLKWVLTCGFWVELRGFEPLSIPAQTSSELQ